MKITARENAKNLKSDEGREAWIYSFPEYEFQYDEQQPGTTLKWHRHEKIWEMIYIIEGELIARWKENGETRKQVVEAGDVIEPGFVSHSLENKSDKVAKFVAVKIVLLGEDKRKIIEKDKYYDE